ncbi:Fc.00g090200.m01.CDS01 [Cosmosporella sp. VM-42]
MSSSRGRPLRLWPDDEEMAKKDDDLHMPGHSRQAGGGQWRATAPRRRVVARLVLYACVALFCFVTLYELATFSVGTSVGETYKKWEQSAYQPLRHDADRHDTPRTDESGTKPAARKDTVVVPKTYTGAVKFLELAKSLRSISATGGSLFKNRNVLFAAASLKSASTLLPMACQMVGERDNYVHFAFVGRSDISLEELLKANGIDEACKLILHDARPDHATESTDKRMTLASARALFHINMYMHPQAILVDATDSEEEYFLRGFRDQIRTTRSTLIELPDRPGVRLAWVTKLDAAALAAWNKVHFDILVHAPLSGTGNIERLLRSLAQADFGSVSVPHLTVELPPIIEEPLEKFFSGYQWPPWSLDYSDEAHTFSLRHRIPRQKLDEEESSVRFLESFWPTHPSDSHVLVLSPHTEVSPQFFHYVKFALLQHRYSADAILQDWDRKLMGISFQHPTTHLDTKTPFDAPEADAAGNGVPPFLWQSPSSEAVLFMGDKWVELHGYLSQLLERKHSKEDTPSLLATKEVGKSYPAWLEHVLQLSRLRGYVTLYPSKETAGTILGVHNDLYDKPEEYIGEDPADEETEPGEADVATEAFDTGSQVDMLVTLPQGGIIPPLKELPLLSWDGKPAVLEDLDKTAAEYLDKFRREVGGCTEAEAKKLEADKYARDLFCNTKGTKETEKAASV